jgi:hypothetical protein
MESTEKEKELWKIAKKRVGFRRQLFMYIIVNIMFWLVWYYSEDDHTSDFPWPVWPMIGWGIGIVFSYYDAYASPKSDAIQREYEKLTKNGNV